MNNISKITRENYFVETKIDFSPVTPLYAMELLDGLKAWRLKKIKKNIVTSFGEYEVDFQSEKKSAFWRSRSKSFYFVNVATGELIRISDHWSASKEEYKRSGKLNCKHIASCYWSNMEGEKFTYRLPGEKYSSELLLALFNLKNKTNNGAGDPRAYF